MALIDKDQLKAEIERRIKLHYKEGIRVNADRIDEDEIILAWLDSLPEQPVIKKSNALFDKCVENCDPAVMKEVSDNIDKMLGRQPVEGLEEEIEKYIQPIQAREVQEAPFSSLEKCARHFAEWGAIHFNTRKEE